MDEYQGGGRDLPFLSCQTGILDQGINISFSGEKGDRLEKGVAYGYNGW
jgi:hypothetical protein